MSSPTELLDAIIRHADEISSYANGMRDDIQFGYRTHAKDELLLEMEAEARKIVRLTEIARKDNHAP